jgi:hypothetical protein
MLMFKRSAPQTRRGVSERKSIFVQYSIVEEETMGDKSPKNKEKKKKKENKNKAPAGVTSSVAKK